MTNNKQDSNLTGPTIHQEIERYSKMHPSEYTTTLYDEHRNLLDDGVDLDSDTSYWEAFIDSKQAAELSRRLAIVESEDYEGQEFDQMEDE